jgi:hypothetical protein
LRAPVLVCLASFYMQLFIVGCGSVVCRGHLTWNVCRLSTFNCLLGGLWYLRWSSSTTCEMVREITNMGMCIGCQKLLLGMVPSASYILVGLLAGADVRAGGCCVSVCVLALCPFKHYLCLWCGWRWCFGSSPLFWSPGALLCFLPRPPSCFLPPVGFSLALLWLHSIKSQSLLICFTVHDYTPFRAPLWSPLRCYRSLCPLKHKLAHEGLHVISQGIIYMWTI